MNGDIDIYFLNSFLTTYCPTDQKLFGQFVIGVFLHEIFHNISAVLRLYNAEFKTMISSTMLMASMAKSAKVRRKLITNFVETAKAKFKEKYGKTPIVIDVVIGDGSRKLC